MTQSKKNQKKSSKHVLEAEILILRLIELRVLIEEENKEYGPALFASDHKEKREKLEEIKADLDD